MTADAGGGPSWYATRVVREVSALNHEPVRADETGMGRLVFYPMAIGLFVLLDMALRAHGH